ncbi:redoxin family protein [Pirellulaceae bacterium SH449]
MVIQGFLTSGRWQALGGFVLFFCIGLISLSAQPANASDPSDLSKAVLGPGWSQPALSGELCNWDSSAKAHVVCVLGCECPVARFYAAKLQSIAEQYEPQGVRFVGVMGLLQDNEPKIRSFVKDTEISFPMVRDENQRLLTQLRATRTPEVFVLDERGTVVYRGRVDDQMAPGVKKNQATTQELVDALDAVVKGHPIPTPNTTAAGCLITFAKNDSGPSTKQDAARTDAEQQLASEAKAKMDTGVSAPTYAGNVAAIFNKHCYDCHRPGDIGPFDISNIDEIQGWGEMIVEVIENGRMPPWHASAEHGEFRNARVMSAEEMDLVKNWVSAGSPLGNLDTLPELPEVKTGWQLPKEPDLIVAMRETPFTVPPVGTVEYQYFVVDPKLTEDRWITAAQVIPGNATIVHHAIVFIRPPDGEQIKGVSWLTSFVPGQRAAEYPAGYARKVPAGSKFVFQMHYTPIGKVQQDITKVGLVFVDASEVTHEVSTIAGIDQSFEIPPYAEAHTVRSKISLPRGNSKVLVAAPHMHLRGKSFRLTSVTKRGTEEVLLDVPRYDFNWQHAYEFATPVDVRELESLEFETSYDNSEGNPFNPNPAEYVMWGDQTWEEMAVVFLDVATEIRSRADSALDTAQTIPAAIFRGGLAVDQTEKKEPSEKAVKFAEDFIKRFDRNGDGVVSRAEVSDIVRRYSFNQIDKNGDQLLTREELIEAAEGQRAR